MKMKKVLAVILAVPMYMLLGEYDYGQLPMTMEPGKDAVVQWDCQDLPDNLNNRLETCRRMIQENSNEVCSFLGICGDKNYTKTVDGGTDYIADFQNADGVTMVRFEGAGNLPHLSTAPMPSLRGTL